MKTRSIRWSLPLLVLMFVSLILSGCSNSIEGSWVYANTDNPNLCGETITITKNSIRAADIAAPYTRDGDTLTVQGTNGIPFQTALAWGDGGILSFSFGDNEMVLAKSNSKAAKDALAVRKKFDAQQAAEEKQRVEEEARQAEEDAKAEEESAKASVCNENIQNVGLKLDEWYINEFAGVNIYSLGTQGEIDAAYGKLNDKVKELFPVGMTLIDSAKVLAKQEPAYAAGEATSYECPSGGDITISEINVGSSPTNNAFTIKCSIHSEDQ